VAAGGEVTGTPPDLGAGAFPVTVRVTDNGSPAQTADQSYTLTVVASLAGWQTLFFNLPTEAAIAGPLEDPDGDGLVNLAEYALRRNPRQAEAPGSQLPTFAPNGEITLGVTVRDDDPKLVADMEAAPDVTYQGAVLGTKTTTDPTPGDGLQSLVLKDVVLTDDIAVQRFWRVKLEVKP
jgi:hypothetical protein